MRKVFLDDLPKGVLTGIGIYQINWNKSIGYKIRFVYDDIEGWLKIVDYNSKTQMLNIKYIDNSIFNIHTDNFTKCKMGNLLGIKTSEFKIEIGQIIKDDKRDMTIIDREIRVRYNKNGYKCNDKYYKYKCNKCGWTEGWILESNLLGHKQGCSCCCNRTAVLGINTIWDKARWMCDLGVSEEDAKTHTPQSNDKIYVTCPDCGRIKDKSMRIGDIYRRHSIGCTCSDKISYPNKFSYSLLNQLNKIYKFDHLEHEYSPEWIGRKFYDNYFVFKNKEYILEMDGEFHNKNNNMSGQTKEESKEIDDYKDRLAKEHGIEVIRIDCDYNTNNRFEYIKYNIINSRLIELFDLDFINYNECEEFALNNKIKEACNLWNSGIESTSKISKIIKLQPQTICRYLKIGTKLKWCNYDAKVERCKSGSNNGRLSGKPVKIFKEEIYLGTFPSCMELERKSEELFGIKLNYSNIASVCRGKASHYKGFTFKYINEIEQAI